MKRLLRSISRIGMIKGQLGKYLYLGSFVDTGGRIMSRKSLRRSIIFFFLDPNKLRATYFVKLSLKLSLARSNELA